MGIWRDCLGDCRVPLLLLSSPCRGRLEPKSPVSYRARALATFCHTWRDSTGSVIPELPVQALPALQCQYSTLQTVPCHHAQLPPLWVHWEAAGTSNVTRALPHHPLHLSRSTVGLIPIRKELLGTLAYTATGKETQSCQKKTRQLWATNCILHGCCKTIFTESTKYQWYFYNSREKVKFSITLGIDQTRCLQNQSNRRT